MGKISPTTTKYIIRAQIEVDGVVEESDVVGAIFGQTEGLLGEDLELRKLQKKGKIGRVKVNLKSENDESYGEIVIPSNLSKEDTSIISASLETVERVGPCEANVEIKEIEDLREEKRKYVVERAKELLGKVKKKDRSKTISREVKKSVAKSKVTSYEGLPSGPKVSEKEELILVEGRADVINLLRAGIENVISFEGTKIPKAIKELSKKKKTIAFVDGDRGGELILKELNQVADVDYVARAPEGKEVEDLTFKEIHKALRNKRPMKREGESKEPEFKELFEKVSGKREALILDDQLKILGKVPVEELYSTLLNLTKAYAILLDGYVTENLVNLARKKGAKYLVAKRSKVGKSKKINILTPQDFE